MLLGQDRCSFPGPRSVVRPAAKAHFLLNSLNSFFLPVIGKHYPQQTTINTTSGTATDYTNKTIQLCTNTTHEHEYMTQLNAKFNNSDNTFKVNVYKYTVVY